MAQRWVSAGARVALLDLDVAAVEKRAAELAAGDAEVLALGCDVTDAASCERAIVRVREEWGGIDVLVANAGITHVGLVRETDPGVLRRVMDVNFFGAVHVTQAALPSLLERRGQVVAISSVAGFAPLATRAGYAASKHAVMGFFQTLRCEHARDGLRVTLVCPSFVRTTIGTRALAADGSAAGEDARTGVGNLVEPDEAADVIVRGALAGRRIVWVGREARASYWLSRLWPAAYERLMVRRTLAS